MEQEEINHLKCQNVSALLPMEGDNDKAGAMSATLGISSSNLHHKVIKGSYFLGPVLYHDMLCYLGGLNAHLVLVSRCLD